MNFETLERQAHAARLGMWVFLASEVLLFGAAFAMFAAYQVEYPNAFHEGIAHNTKVLGSINTAVLLVSSTLVAASVHALRAGRRFVSSALVAGTITLAGVFLVIKAVEYGKHFSEGIYPGGAGSYFTEHRTRGVAEYWTLYFGMTGLHAIHVIIGAGVLSFLMQQTLRGVTNVENAHRLEIGAIYWHLVDVIWIFLWPLFYLS
jgi:cytochrome c oxidase subunit 3